MKKLPMRIHFGFAGSANLEHTDIVNNKLNHLIDEFCKYAENYNNPKYGFTGEPLRKIIFSGDRFLTMGMRDFVTAMDIPLTLVTSSHYTNPPALGPNDHLIALDVKPQNLSYPNVTAEYVVNHSDVVILLWDGSTNVQEGHLWTMLQLCKQKRIPYYLVNAKDIGNESFSAHSYYIPYKSESVKEYVKQLYDYEIVQEKLSPIRFEWIWKSWYEKFIHRWDNSTNTPPTNSNDSDSMITEHFFPDNHPSAKNHAELVRFYDHYDSIAMESSKIYRSSMYLRSILPFFAMLAIAIGTYVDIIGDKIAKYTFCDISIWSLLAALGFFVHAILNLYAWRMAKNNRLTHARSNFVSSRFIAEYLRVLIHGEAYAIQLDTVCMDTPLVKKNVLAKLHHILRSLEQLNYIQTSEEIQISAEKFLEFVKNQQTYHNSTCNRYKKISQDLTKWSTHLFFLSFFIVLSNSIIQCGLAIFLSENWKLAGIIFDFLSLLIPAWASYFSTKLTLNNFDWLYQNSADMLKGYKRIENDLVKIIEDKKHNSCQIMNDIANDIMGLCQSDFTNWYLRTDSQTFTPL